uniref:Uncharacterized protein n=1 Tax=Anguilla anguilla TaxID=7936 RepID=A0A0E9U8I6_ANGAN
MNKHGVPFVGRESEREHAIPLSVK